MLALAFATAAPLRAQQIVPIPPPILAPPALPNGPVGRQLSNAYGAIVAAGARDPFAAQQAAFAYAQALQRARAGDVSGALAAAASAQAQALAGAMPGQVPPIRAIVPMPFPAAMPAARAPLAGLPIVGSGVPLTPDLENARDEIALATRANGRGLDGARRHYRAALDAYVSGDAVRSRVEARSAYEAAASGLPVPK